MTNLRDRYFVAPFEQEQQAREQIRERWARMARFVHEDYFKEFRMWLQTRLEAARPRPTAENDMLYKIGVNDGLKEVADHLDKLVRDVEALSRGGTV